MIGDEILAAFDDEAINVRSMAGDGLDIVDMWSGNRRSIIRSTLDQSSRGLT
jgi:hypothetical protein